MKLKWMKPHARCEAKTEDKRGAPWRVATITHVIRRTRDVESPCSRGGRIRDDTGKKGDVLAVIVQYDGDLELISKKPHLIRKPGVIDQLAAIVRPPPGRRYGGTSASGAR